MLDFGTALPRLRRGVARDLKVAHSGARVPAAELTEQRILACAVRLLDLGFFRIGSEDYAERNESYGLTTMLREHVTVGKLEVIFDFPAKSGQRRVQAIADPDALAMLAALKRRRTGSQLLAYRSADGWSELTAEEVNVYLKRKSGGPFTAKDFRTWNATVLAAVALAGAARAPRGPPARSTASTESLRAGSLYWSTGRAVALRTAVSQRTVPSCGPHYLSVRSPRFH